jgi:energy-converting hydrogenase Eha subunit G
MENRKKPTRERSKRTQPATRLLRWKQLGIRGVIVLALCFLTVGYYVIDLFVHPSLWNTFVFLAMVGFIGFIVYSNITWSRSKRKRRRRRAYWRKSA